VQARIALKELAMGCRGRATGALIVLAWLVLAWPLAAAHAQPAFCAGPFADREQETICTDPESRKSERRLFVEMQALTALLDAGDVVELEREQTQWRRERRAACEVMAANEELECYADRAANRAIVLRRQVDYILKEGAATLSLRDLQLDVRWIVARKGDGAIVTQLRHGSRVLAEADGPNRFDLLARAGNDDAEAIVVRAHKEGSTYAIVGRNGAPPEIWQYRLSRSWMKQPPAVEAQGERLEIREQAEAEPFGELIVDSTARLWWTPSTGWRMAEPYRARRPIPQPRVFFGGAASGNDCKSVFESQETIKFGSRSLTVGRTAGPWVLAFGCEILIESGPRLFDLTIERRLGAASVMLSTEYNAGNLGFVDRHVLADIAGHGIQIWEFPNSDASAVATSFGYLFLPPADPGMDGGIYRWTPSTGFNFEGYQAFTPTPHSVMPMVEAPKADEEATMVTENLLRKEEVYRSFESASGPSFIRLAFDLAGGGAWRRTRLERQWAPELAVFTDCDGSRFCNDGGNKMFGVFVEKTRQFYFAFSQDKARATADFRASSRPSVWEFHPPFELWPQEAVAAVESRFSDLIILGGSGED
jgi:hypothetical protein